MPDSNGQLTPEELAAINASLSGITAENTFTQTTGTTQEQFNTVVQEGVDKSLLQQLGEALNATSQGAISQSEVQAQQNAANFQPEATLGPVIANSEDSFGAPLSQAEKPMILAIMAERMNKNGTPASNTIFIKKTPNDTGIVVRRYSIYRKDLFSELNFTRIGEINPDGFALDPDYKNIVTDIIHADPAQVVIFHDETLSSDRVYAYRIKMEFDLANSLSSTQTAAERAVVAGEEG